MKALLILFGAFLCCQLATAGSIGSLDGYRKISSYSGLDHVIQSGTVAALNLAAADGVVDANAAARYQVESIGRVAAKELDAATSYFIVVRVGDAHYPDVKAIVGFVIDEERGTGTLTLRAYKIGSA